MKRVDFKTMFLLFLVLVLESCNKHSKVAELKYKIEEFDHLVNEATAVNPVGENAIPFHDYSPGVNKLNSRSLIYQRLKFYAVEFDSETTAHNEALRLNQYYSRNFLFDLVEGEPILEDYVIKTFGAINPNRAVQRAPKKAEGHSEHSTEHSEHSAHPTHQ
jgi:hypothetical protein